MSPEKVSLLTWPMVLLLWLQSGCRVDGITFELPGCPLPQRSPNYLADPITEEEAKAAWGRTAIQIDCWGRMKRSPQCMKPRWSDLDTPIADVMAEHPDIDPYCYFGYHGNWLQVPPVLRARHQYGWGDPMARRIEPNWGRGVFSDGTEVTMHIGQKSMDNDDFYCFALGWLRNQGLNASLVQDWDAWTKLSYRECEKIKEEYDFADSELTMRSHVNGFGATLWRCGCSVGFRGENCNRVSKRELKLHAYHKCIMGMAGAEMAYCVNRACLLPQNQIGHHEDCSSTFPF